MSEADEFNDGVEPGPDVSAEPLKKRRKESLGQSIGGVLFGFEQQVLRTMPPSQELVHHARPDAPMPAGDGSLIHISMPGVSLPDEMADAGADATADADAAARADPESGADAEARAGPGADPADR